MTLQSIYDDMDALPPGRTVANKHYVGFWSGGELVAVLDLVEDYPREDTAMLGFFMMDARHQGDDGTESVKYHTRSVQPSLRAPR